MPRLLGPSIFSLLIVLASPCLAGESIQASTVVDKGVDVLRLTLGPDLGGSWADAHVARLVIRAGGVQTSVDRERLKASNQLDLPLAKGCSVVLLDLGSPDEKGMADSWYKVRHSTKILTCSDLGDPRKNLDERRRAGALAMSKTGSRLEIRPMMNPATVRAGSDLAVIVYAEGVPLTGAKVWAEGPQGRRVSAVTDQVGAANFRIPVHGAWRIVYRAGQGGAESTADLRFEVASPEAWREMVPELADAGGVS